MVEIGDAVYEKVEGWEGGGDLRPQRSAFLLSPHVPIKASTSVSNYREYLYLVTMGGSCGLPFIVRQSSTRTTTECECCVDLTAYRMNGPGV